MREHDILKTRGPILMQIVTSSPRNKDMDNFGDNDKGLTMPK